MVDMAKLRVGVGACGAAKRERVRYWPAMYMH